MYQRTRPYDGNHRLACRRRAASDTEFGAIPAPNATRSTNQTEGVSRDPRHLLALTLAQRCRLEGPCIISRVSARICPRRTKDWPSAPEHMPEPKRLVETKSIKARERSAIEGGAGKPSWISTLSTSSARLPGWRHAWKPCLGSRMMSVGIQNTPCTHQP